MAEINLKKLLDESMLKEIDQDCIILNEEQADELYGGAEWGYYGVAEVYSYYCLVMYCILVIKTIRNSCI